MALVMFHAVIIPCYPIRICICIIYLVCALNFRIREVLNLCLLFRFIFSDLRLFAVP